jgi:hypothetical protein
VQGGGLVAHELVERHAHGLAACQRSGVGAAARDEFVAQRGQRVGRVSTVSPLRESASRTEAK